MSENTATLSDGVMKRLAEDMGVPFGKDQMVVFVDLPEPLGFAHCVFAYRVEDGYMLAPAGCWLVMKAKRVEICPSMDCWDAYVLDMDDKVISHHNDSSPESALCEAIFHMYGEGDE